MFTLTNEKRGGRNVIIALDVGNSNSSNTKRRFWAKYSEKGDIYFYLLRKIAHKLFKNSLRFYKISSVSSFFFSWKMLQPILKYLILILQTAADKIEIKYKFPDFLMADFHIFLFQLQKNIWC